MSRSRIIALSLAVVTLLVYLPVLRCTFVDFDDDDYVTQNPMVQKGLTSAGVVWAFNDSYADNWHPLTWLSHMADCELFGVNPHAHHLVNALYHAANAALLFALLFRLTASLHLAFFIAALFAWHPMHVESVAWIAERKDVLSTFFALLALLSYVKYARDQDRGHYWIALLFFALGLLSKPMVVTLPLVMLLLDFWPLQRINGYRPKVAGAEATGAQNGLSLVRLVVEKWPFFALVMVSCAMTMVAQSHDFRGHTAVASLDQVPLATRLKNVPVAYVLYLLKLFWPAKLAVFYPLPAVVPAVRVAGAALLLLVVSGLAWCCRRERPWLGMGWLWFLGILLPVIGLVQVGNAALADRYSYLPSVGIFIIIAFAAGAVAARWVPLQKILTVVAGMVLVACICLTERQLSFWRDSETLFRHALAMTADNDLARNNLGYVLQERGQYTEAVAEFRAAAALAPAKASTHNNLANALDLAGQPAESLAEYRRAIQLVPADASQHTGAGYELGVLGQFSAALDEFTLAEKLASNYPAPHVQAAQVCFKMGRDAEGLGELRAALQLAPDDWHILSLTAHYLAANENAGSRDGPSAMKLAAKASILTAGGVASVADVLGMACAETGDFTDAEDSVQHAIELAGTNSADAAPLQRRLKLYQQHQTWRESFRAPGQGSTNGP